MLDDTHDLTNDDDDSYTDYLNDRIAADRFGLTDEEWEALSNIAAYAAGTLDFCRRLQGVVADMKDPETSLPDEPHEVQVVAGRFSLLMYWMAYDTGFADRLYAKLATDMRLN